MTIAAVTIAASIKTLRPPSESGAEEDEDEWDDEAVERGGVVVAAASTGLYICVLQSKCVCSVLQCVAVCCSVFARRSRFLSLAFVGSIVKSKRETKKKCSYDSEDPLSL